MSALADASARERALNPAESFLVQAPAGSGKTELLTRRFLVLLGRVARPEEILAITFTRKAAAEMGERILRTLQLAESGEPCRSEHEVETRALAREALERSREGGWDLSQNPARLRIHTIDGFMGSLVARMPWLSRMGAPPRIADRPEDLYEEAADQVIAQLGSDDAYAEAVMDVLDHLDNHASYLRALLVDLLARRDQWLRHRVRLDPDTLRPGLENSLETAVRRKLANMRARLSGHERELSDLARWAASNVPADHALASLCDLERLPGAEPDDLSAWQGLAHLLLTSAGQWRRPGGVNKNLGFPTGRGDPETFKIRMKDLLTMLGDESETRDALDVVRRLPQPCYSEGQWAIVSAVIRVVDLAITHLWEIMGRGRQADFVEVALRALGGLGDVDGPSELLLALDRRISHILVDEFQDTSHMQYQLLERLTEGWSPGDGRTLFLVGDPMQSIYRFREADVGLFLRGREEGIGPVRLEPLRLQANFRSQQGVVDWVNGAFADVFPRESDASVGAVTYEPSWPVHPQSPGPAVEFRASAAHDAEAEALEVAAAAEAGLDEGTVAVLVRSRTHLPAILRALEARGLRYQAQDVDPLGSRPVVRDIVSLTRALLHPGDRLSWLALLRAPWCGLTLADLHAVAGGSDRPVPELVQEPDRLAALSEDGRTRFERCWRALGSSMNEARRRRLRAWVQGAWVALGAPAYLTDQEMADAEAAFDLIASLDRGGEIRPLEALEKRLEGLFAAPDPEAGEGLQVMTIHKAKGLEFDTVLLPGLGRVPRSPGRRLLYWLETPEEELLLAPLPPKIAGAQDSIVDYIRSLDAAKERYERARLLYVAVTRASKRAVLWGHASTDRDGRPKVRRGSLLESLWPVVSGLFEDLPPTEDKAPVGPARTAVTKVRRLPRPWVLPEPCRSVEPVAPAPPGDLTSAPEFEWAGETARHVGTVVHRMLQRIAEEGLEAWTAAAVERSRTFVGAQLTALGVSGTELPEAVQRAVAAVRSSVEDPKGRWLLAPREGARSELKLTRKVGDRFDSRAVDRTFVLEGTRWIVDFKTSSHEGGEVEKFLDTEVLRYRDQLRTYAELFRALEPGCPVRAGLYYPLLRAWREVEV